MRALALLTLAFAITGCGGGGSKGTGRGAKADASTVIRAWADDVRMGHFKQAAQLFALPAMVSNGEPNQRLRTRAEVDLFNRSFPCGAVLLGTQKQNGGLVLATFRLTDGAGGRLCGTSKGSRARVSFRIRDAHIVEWLREGTGPPPGSTET